MSLLRLLYGKVSVDLGVELGTGVTKVFMAGGGMILEENSCVAVSWRDSEIVAYGNAAGDMVGRSPQHIEIIRPVEEGLIRNFELAEQMLRHFMTDALKGRAALGARVAMVVPAAATDVQKKAFDDMAQQAGAREVILVESPVAAAVGLNLPISDRRCYVIIHIGAGTTQAAVFLEGELLFTASAPVGGDTITQAIIAGIRKKHNTIIGFRTAQRIKEELVNVAPAAISEESTEVFGKTLVNGLPGSFTITSSEAAAMINDVIERFASVVRGVLSRVPAEAVDDLATADVRITGGTGLLKGLAEYISRRFEIKCVSSPDARIVCSAGAALIAAGSRDYAKFSTTAHGKRFRE